ncbi:hypothetical protein JCM8547_007705 [Rhodosporidiobolus lusitaniae]
MATSLAIPKTADAAALASAFSLDAAWSSAAASPAAVQNNTDAGLSTFDLLQQLWSAAGSGAPNTAWVADPFDGGNTDDVLQVTYPAGTRDGTQFSMRVFDEYRAAWNTTVQTALLKYELAFSDDFEFVLGGKLPGLYGASPNASTICSGGNRETDCFSARLMWRERGAGEVYAYLPTSPGFCHQSDVYCNDDYGISLSRGSWQFKKGGWTTITQLIALNTPGYANGLLYLYANDTLALAHTGLTWRTAEDVTLTSVFFSTFFGGSSSSWNSKGGTASFRRFEVYASSAASNTTGPAVNATADGGWTSSSPPTSSPSSSLFRLFTFLTLSSFLLQLAAFV